MDITYIGGRSVVQIASSIERAIREGRLADGARLPPVRILADELGVNRNTIAGAYARLRDAGLVSGTGRQGTVVTTAPQVDAYRSVVPSTARDLASGNVDPELLPDLRRHLMELSPAPAGYELVSDDAGAVSLARRLFEADGIVCDGIAVVSGAMDGLERLLRTHVRPGDSIAVEDPGFVAALLLIRSLGLKPVPVPLDAEGMLPDRLAAAIEAGAKAVLITPRAQNPTGACLTASRAEALRTLLDRHPEVLLVEDDHAGPIAGVPSHSASPASGGGRPWAVIRSVSKSLGPDLRVAFVAGEPILLSRLRSQQALGPRWVSHILQRLVVSLWSAPETAPLIRRAALSYTERRAALIARLAERGIPAFGASGLHVWVPVAREAETVQGMLTRGWAVQAGEVFRLRSGPGIRIGVANLAVDEASEVAYALWDVLRAGRAIYT